MKHPLSCINKLLIATILPALLLSGCTTQPVTQALPAEASVGNLVQTKNLASNQHTSNLASVSGKMTVNYIDVGQADSILIQTPSGKNILIDAGNRNDDSTVKAFLVSKAVKKIDIVIGTHPHEDHIGGMSSIINSFDIGQIYMPKVATNTKTFSNLLKTVKMKGLKINTALAGTEIPIDPSVKSVLLAPKSGQSYKDINNYSAVLKVTFGSTSFLFDGDAEDVSEFEMLASGEPLKADVLKVGHHGSKSSSTEAFLKEVSPKYAIISVGTGNDYGHPAESTISRLASLRIETHRTDLEGTITVTSDGSNITFTSQKTSSEPKTSVSPITESTQSVPVVAPEVKPTPQKQAAPDITVYITNAGEKYHNDGCRSLRKSRIPISLGDAKAQGYGACKICNPPQ